MALLYETKLFLSPMDGSFSSLYILLSNKDANQEAKQEMGVSSPDFRAPPPSPVASIRRASYTANEDVLSEFLDKCGRVPNLVLPDKVFPKQRALANLPTFDFHQLGSLSELIDAVTTIGCFQLINHGISKTKVRAAMDKTIFVDETEELVVYKEDIADDQTKGPGCYSDIRELMGEAERIGKTIRAKLEGRCQEEEEGVGVCYVKKKHCNTKESEAIRMLIRGYDERHSLCISICDAEFHIYSKRGWFSFSPRPDAVVVTVGDRGWNGRFRGVVGRPLLYNESLLQHHHVISISFLYTTIHKNSRGISKKKKKKTVSISQQLLFALFLTLLLPFFLP